jgi:hypothetical protein
MNPVEELIAAAENALGFVWGEAFETAREAEDLPPIVPQRFRGIAAEQVFTRLDKAVRAYKESRQVVGEISIDAAKSLGFSGHYFDY